MKQVFLLFATLIYINIGFSQAVETTTTYNKLQQPGATIELAVPVDIAEEVIKAEMKNKGFGKGDVSKGYTLYKAVNFNELSADKVDFYIKVDKKSKKDKANSIVTAMVSKGYDNFVNSAADPKMMAALINYLNNLKPKFTARNLAQQIIEQEETVKKEEKKQTSITDDISDLEKKIAKLQKEVADKKNDLEKQKAEVAKQIAALEQLKAKKN